jgi:hypothetical protein
MTPRWQRAYVIATCAIIGAAFAYAACDWARWPRLTYMPVRGEWSMGSALGSTAMTYLGVVLWGIGGLTVGALAGSLLCRFKISDRLMTLLGAWAITAILLAGAYETWSSWPW